jgi:hypothetical protein
LIRISPDDSRPAAPQPASPQLIIPAYFHPTIRADDWALMAENAPSVRLMIMNVANGPGETPDLVWIDAISRLRRAGVAVAGYVDTNYARRPALEILADIGRYVYWYEVDGVCFDRASGSREHLAHYAELAGRAREMGAATVVFNHGAHPAEGYADHGDVLGTFEGPWSRYASLAVPRWTRSRPADKFYHVVYAVPPEHHADAFMLAERRRAGCTYITERDGANPYDQLPASGLVPPPIRRRQ